MSGVRQSKIYIWVSGRKGLITIESHQKSPFSTGLYLIFGVYVFLLVIPRTLRVDRGTETDVMATIHCFLREKHGDLEDPTDAVLYGPSTQNKIERWWRYLHERMERFFKDQLKSLVESGEYDSSDKIDRHEILVTVVPVLDIRDCIFL